VRHGTAVGDPEAQHGGNTSNPKKVVTMRPVRILLVAIALVAVALTGWAFGARDSGYSKPEAVPTATTTAPLGDPAAAPAPAPQPPRDPDGDIPSDTPPTTQPPPRPRILGFGSEPVLPKDGGFWQLSPGGGVLTLVLDARNATRVEYWLTPTGTEVQDLAVRIGQDTNGRDGWVWNWRYPNEPILGHLTVKAIGPGGTAEKVVGVYHPDPVQQP
jgi:hypothetical protein